MCKTRCLEVDHVMNPIQRLMFIKMLFISAPLEVIKIKGNKISLGTRNSGTIPDGSVPVDFFHQGNLQF